MPPRARVSGGKEKPKLGKLLKGEQMSIRRKVGTWGRHMSTWGKAGWLSNGKGSGWWGDSSSGRSTVPSGALSHSGAMVGGDAWFYNFHFSRCLWMQCRESWARRKGTDLGGTKSSTCKTTATMTREQEVEMW